MIKWSNNEVPKVYSADKKPNRAGGMPYASSTNDRMDLHIL